MPRRWIILAALTLARLTMGVAFQAVAALAPSLMARTGMSWAEVGALIGAFMLPGVAAALAGGWMGARWGDSRVAIGGLAVMAAAGAAMAWLADFEALFAARLILGAGAVALNVMLTKMAADWFEGEDLPVALGLLSSSWPMGMALALLVLPPAAARLGERDALLGVALLCALACVLIAGIWRRPPGQAEAAAAARARLDAGEMRAVVLAGLAWGCFNVAFAGTLSFTPDLFVSRGMDPQTAAAVVSVSGWVSIVSIAAGGWIARAIGGRGPTLAVCGIGGAATLAWIALDLPATGTSAVLAVSALLVGPAAGVILAMPSVATRPASRAMGMGVFFALYYALMAIGPFALGWLRGATDDAAVPVLGCAALYAAMLIPFLLFERRIRARPAPA